jgi:hypothetical protein
MLAWASVCQRHQKINVKTPTSLTKSCPRRWTAGEHASAASVWWWELAYAGIYQLSSAFRLFAGGHVAGEHASICQLSPAFWLFPGSQLANTPSLPVFGGESWHTPAYASAASKIRMDVYILLNTPAWFCTQPVNVYILLNTILWFYTQPVDIYILSY